MLQTKIFTATDSSKLEKSMNEWLEVMGQYGFEVKHVKYLATQHAGTTTRYSVLIVYKTQETSFN